MSDIIPVAAIPTTCRACGHTVRRLPFGQRTLTLEARAVHGITERYDSAGLVEGYDQLAVYPVHVCRPAEWTLS